MRKKGPHGGRAKSILRAADGPRPHDCPYSDMLVWVLENYHRIMRDVQPNVKNEKARQAWVVRADQELTGLFQKWGKHEPKART